MKVLIADDQILFRESIGYILSEDPEIEVLGLCADGAEVVSMCQKKKPDMVLMDIEMPGKNGVCATKEIKTHYPEIKIIILTTFENVENILESFVVGADGYVVKNINHQDLILAMKCVDRGLTVMDESVKKIMTERFKGLSDYKANYEERIDEVEIQIIKLVAMGKSNKEIGATLNYSEGTVKNKISRIFEKLELSDRMQLAIFAIENGLV